MCCCLPSLLSAATINGHELKFDETTRSNRKWSCCIWTCADRSPLSQRRLSVWFYFCPEEQALALAAWWILLALCCSLLPFLSKYSICESAADRMSQGQKRRKAKVTLAVFMHQRSPPGKDFLYSRYFPIFPSLCSPGCKSHRAVANPEMSMTFLHQDKHMDHLSSARGFHY